MKTEDRYTTAAWIGALRDHQPWEDGDLGDVFCLCQVAQTYWRAVEVSGSDPYEHWLAHIAEVVRKRAEKEQQP